MKTIRIQNKSNFSQIMVVNNENFKLKPFEEKEILVYKPRKVYLKALGLLRSENVKIEENIEDFTLDIKAGYVKYIVISSLLILIVFLIVKGNLLELNLNNLSIYNTIKTVFYLLFSGYIILYSALLDYKITIKGNELNQE